MRILLLNLYYPPDTSATAKMALAVVAELSAKHDVTVLCGRPSYDPTERRAWRLWRTEVSGRVKIIRAGSTDYSRQQMKRRVLNYLSYVTLSVPRALLVPCDLVLAMWVSRKDLQLQPGGEHVVDGVTYRESERGHAGYTTEGTTGLPVGGDMDFVDYANADETALLSFERWAPDMPWEVSTGKSVVAGELTVYPAPPATA